MSRFTDEISGKLGAFWKQSAENAVKDLMSTAEDRIHVEDCGAARWKSSGNYLPEDICEMLDFGGFQFNHNLTTAKRKIQDKKSIEAYKKQMKNHVYSDEEMTEMRAAFGAGTTVVNAITGEKITL